MNINEWMNQSICFNQTFRLQLLNKLELSWVELLSAWHDTQFTWRLLNCVFHNNGINKDVCTLQNFASLDGCWLTLYERLTLWQNSMYEMVLSAWLLSWSVRGGPLISVVSCPIFITLSCCAYLSHCLFRLLFYASYIRSTAPALGRKPRLQTVKWTTVELLCTKFQLERKKIRKCDSLSGESDLNSSL